MRTWTANACVRSEPESILGTLVDPDAIRRWAPVDFDVEELHGDRLRAGSRARVVGRLAGLRVGFDVEVGRADEERVSLAAAGPVGFEVDYELSATQEGSEVCASVRVRGGGGVTARMLAKAIDALLAGGALELAVARIAREAELSAMSLTSELGAGPCALAA